MDENRGTRKDIVTFVAIISAYVLAQTLTLKLINPIQNSLTTQFVGFAALIYLPHGVRVLATMYFRWRAIIPLILGNLLARYLNSTNSAWDVANPNLISSAVIGGMSAFVAFEIFRGFGRNYYASDDRVVNWRHVMAVGTLAAVINTIGISMVFHDRLPPDDRWQIQIAYVLGGVFGLLVTLLGMMFVFRWVRLFGQIRRR